MKPRFWIASVCCHLLVLLVGSLLASQKAEFGMEVAPSSVEVDLVAAAPSEEPEPETPAEEALEMPPEKIIPRPDDMLILEPDKPEVPTMVYKPNPVVKANKQENAVGDGSSPIPGKDAATAHASHGANVSAKPKYNRNPEPPYPEACKRNKQQGRVLLSVVVNAQGRVESVSVKSSCGFKALDDSALVTIREKWVFSPAKMAGVPVSSKVDIPIRFQLD